MAIFPNINPLTTSGSDLATLLNSFRDSVVSGFLSSTGRPTGVTKGGYWIDNSDEVGLGVFRYYMFDGASDVLAFTLSKTTGRIAFPIQDGSVIVKQVSADAVGAIVEVFKARIADNGKVLSGDQLGTITFASTDDTGAKISDAVSLEAVALENHTGAAQGTKLNLYTKLATTATKFLQMSFGPTIDMFNHLVFKYASADANSLSIGFRKARGTLGAETATQSGDDLGYIGARGYGATGYNGGNRTSLWFRASENHTDTAQGAKATIRSTENGTTVIKDRVTVDHDGGVILHGNTSGEVKIKPDPTTVSYALKLPAAQGAAGQVPTNDGAGNLTWETPAAGGGGGGAGSGGKIKTATMRISGPTTVGIGGGGLLNYSELIDEDGIWDDSNKRFIIPAGTVGTAKGVIHASFQMSSAFAVSDGYIAIRKNGAGSPEKYGMYGVEGTILQASFPVEGVAGDYWEVWFETGNAGTHETPGGSSVCWARYDLYPNNGFGGWEKITVDHTDLQAAALTNNFTLLTLPAKSIVEAIMIKTTTNFDGGSISAYDVTVGITGNQTKYLPSYDANAAVAGGNYDITSVANGADDFDATEAIKIYATAVGDNLDQTTQGSLDIFIKYATID